MEREARTGAGGSAGGVHAWLRSLRATLAVVAILLLTTWLAASIGKEVEGHAAPKAPMFFDRLATYLVWFTLAVAPVLLLALRFDLLGRIHRLRFKLFAALLVGQAAALIVALWAAYSKAMVIDPPSDGLFAMLLVYASVLSLALFYLLADSMAAALARIRAGAARIAEGDLQTRVSVQTRDELADLAADLNAMAGRLAAAAARERRAERSRRELIAAVSHDLRTPLSAIHATIEAITDGVVADEETIRRYLRTMHAGTKELSRLIDDLFELSRLDAGAFTLSPAPTAVPDLISDVLEQMRPRAEARQVLLCGYAENGLPLVPLDGRHISRVLVNLVDNALRHTPAHGRVEVAARRDGMAVRVEVMDTGEGIAPADLPYIFERFYRGEKSRSREHGGAGLGLAISKGIVEAHGGTIRAETLYPRGTRITFTLPLRDTAPQPTPATPALSPAP